MIAALIALLAVVNSPVNSVTYACDGVTAAYTVNFPYLASSDLAVTSTTAAGAVTTLVQTTDWSVNLSSTSSTASLTLNSPATKCLAGSTLKIARTMSLTQPQSFKAQTTYAPSVHEQAFDRAAMLAQQNAMMPLSGADLTGSLPAPVLTATGVVAGTYGNPTNVPIITFNTKGRATSASMTPVSVVGTTTTYTAPLVGAGGRPSASKMGDVISVLDFTGVDSTGVADSTTGIQAAITAITSAQSGVYFPCGRYKLTSAIAIPIGARLSGQSKACVVLSFPNATAGLTFAAGVQNFSVEHLTVSTSNAGALKALDMSAGSTGGLGYGYFTIRDVAILVSGAGRWATGIDARFAESANVTGLKIFQSATIGVYLADSSNQLKFYDLEITGGGPADLSYNRGIWVDANPSGTASPEFFGATSQGCFSIGSAVYVTGHQPKFYGLHAEGTCASADGGDVVVNGASDVSIYGAHIVGAMLVTGTVRGFLASGMGSCGAITFGAAVQSAYIRDSRVASITDNGVVNSPTDNGNGWSAVRLTNGGALRNKGMVEIDNGTSATSITAPTNAVASYPNGGISYWRKAAGANVGVLQLTAADQVFLRYPAASQITIGNDTPTSKITITDTGVTLGSTLPLTLSPVTFATLPTPANLSIIGCSDCTSANPCAAGGTGAIAKRLNGIWVCN